MKLRKDYPYDLAIDDFSKFISRVVKDKVVRGGGGGGAVVVVVVVVVVVIIMVCYKVSESS